jgi:hypothetical protein
MNYQSTNILALWIILIHLNKAIRDKLDATINLNQ